MIRISALAGLLALAACQAATGPEIVTQDGWARATADNQGNAAIYLTVVNKGGADDQLIAAKTNRARMAMIHEVKSDSGISRMRMVGGVDIPAGQTVQLRPGGTHIMLDGLTAPLIAGDHFTMQVRFEKSGERQISVTVEQPGAR